MKRTDNIFAKDQLSKAVRFITALRITSSAFFKKGFSSPVILYALMDAIEESHIGSSISSRQVSMVAGAAFSKETTKEIIKYFADTYHNDDLLIGWLNKKITAKGISKFDKAKDYTEEEAITTVKSIINDDLLSNLDLSF